jgi:hypothetical protein
MWQYCGKCRDISSSTVEKAATNVAVLWKRPRQDKNYRSNHSSAVHPQTIRGKKRPAASLVTSEFSSNNVKFKIYDLKFMFSV